MIEQNNNSISEKPHSRLGVASVVIGVAVPLLLILIFAVAILLGTKKDSVGNYILIGGIIFSMSAPLLYLVGIIFGVIGWVSKKTKNLYPIIGTILNSILGIIGVLLVLLMFYLLIDISKSILH